MYLRSIFVSSVALLANTVTASDVLELTPKNFDTEVFGGTPSLVEFFAPWCGHCKNLAPTWEELATSFKKSSSKIKVAKVDGDAHKTLSTTYGINGFPTIKYFDGKSKDPVDYSGGRGLEDLQSFIEEKTGTKAKKVGKAPSLVENLTDKTFNDVVGKAKGVFVAFTAPWCGHCKTLAPTWEKLAADFAGDSAAVTIAKVDAEANKAIASAQGVSSYPTIKYFPPGSTTPIAYSGGRDEETLVEYVNEKAGLHRVVGGGLDLKAGTVAALDTIAAKFASAGEDLKAVTEEATKAAQGLKDKYAEYYIKVLNKLAENEGYVLKESSRLDSILKKGGLAREKEDDLISRLNILKKFTPTDDSKEEL